MIVATSITTLQAVAAVLVTLAVVIVTIALRRRDVGLDPKSLG